MRVLLLGSLAPASLSAEELQQHGAATFLLDGISRAASHQLVRHRLASFSQESQRYVDLSKIAQPGIELTVTPPAIAQNPETRVRFEQAMHDLERAYGELRALGIRKEDSRFLLPNASVTRIVVTMDFSAWRHFCWLRCDKAAQCRRSRGGRGNPAHPPPAGAGRVSGPGGLLLAGGTAAGIG